MFKHLFINKFKILLRNKTMLFWSLVFPFILGTLFQLALRNVGDMFDMEIIPIAVVDNQYYQENKILKEVITDLSESGENQLFDTVYVSKESAQKLLDNEEIDGYILLNEDNNPQMVVKTNGINQTIIKSVLDEYYQMFTSTNKMINYNPKILYNGVLEKLNEDKNYIIDDSNENIDFSLNYFLTLIAMTCLYGSLIGLEVIKDSEANLSKKGARMCMAPVNKFKVILSGLLAGYVIQLVALVLLFLYLIFVFKVNFGSQIIPTVVLVAVGCLAGISLGTFVGVSNRKNEGFKIGVLISVTMLCCFFSGMMGVISIKVFFDETFPLLAKINPINIITDGLYSLFAYKNLDVYYNCLIRISIFSLILIVLSSIFIRRKKYDSI